MGEKQTHLFLLAADGPPAAALSVYMVPIPSKALQEQINPWRQAVTTPYSGLTQVVARRRALFAKLFPPPAQRRLRAARRLLISPDGPLWELPFAALVTNLQGPAQYFGARQAITYTPSLAVFAQARREAPPPAGSPIAALVVGDPLFDRRRGAQTVAASRRAEFRGERHYLFDPEQPPAPLPGTQQEAVEVARLYGSYPLTGVATTEAALRQGIETADVIHLATHGYFHRVRPMSSGLLLTEPEKEPDIGETNNDGVLQAWEIHSQLHLQAELVVLSACESGQGQTVRAEGLIGLTRALQYAGARSVVASQWRVADRTTARLMVAFHRQVRRGVAKDEALRAAMRSVREGAQKAHPYYWAAFILTGDPENHQLGEEFKRP